MTEGNPEALDLGDIDIEDQTIEGGIELDDIDVKEAGTTKNPLATIKEETDEELEEEKEEIPNTTSPKELFNKITGIIEDSEDKKSDRIAELRDAYQTDKGLSMFAESAIEVINSDKFNEEEKKQITTELSKKFEFIKEDTYSDKTDDEKTELAATALINVIGACTIKENGEQDADLTKNITDLFAEGLKTSAPEILDQAEELEKSAKKSGETDEEELKKKSSNSSERLSPEERIADRQKEKKIWEDTTSLVRQGGKASLYLALLLVVPPPANLIAAAAAFLFTRNMGVKEENKEESHSHPNYKNSDLEKKLNYEAPQEMRQQSLVTIDNGIAGNKNLEKATGNFLGEGKNDLDKDKAELETTKNALGSASENIEISTEKNKTNLPPNVKKEVSKVVEKLVNEVSEVANEGKTESARNSALPEVKDPENSQKR